MMSTSDPETTCVNETMKRKNKLRNGLTMTEHEPKKPKYIELNDGEECLKTLQKLLNDDLKTSPPDTELTINYGGKEPLDEVLDSIFEICDDASDVLRNLRLKGSEDLIGASSNAKKSEESVENTKSQNSNTVSESGVKSNEEIIFEQLINQLKTVEGYDEEDWGKNINIGVDSLFYCDREEMSADEKDKCILEFLEDDSSSSEDITTDAIPQNCAQDSIQMSDHTSPVSNHNHEENLESGSGEFFEESAYLNEGSYYQYEDNYFDIDINRLPDEMITSSFVLDYVLRDIPLNVPSSDKVSRSSENDEANISENFEDSKPGLQATSKCVQDSLENNSEKSYEAEAVTPVVEEKSDHDIACEATTPPISDDSSASEAEAVSPLALEESDDDSEVGTSLNLEESLGENLTSLSSGNDSTDGTEVLSNVSEEPQNPEDIADLLGSIDEEKPETKLVDEEAQAHELPSQTECEGDIRPREDEESGIETGSVHQCPPTPENIKVTPTPEDIKVTHTPEDIKMKVESHEEMKQTDFAFFKLKPCRVLIDKLDASVLEKFKCKKENTTTSDVEDRAPISVEASSTSSTPPPLPPPPAPTQSPTNSELLRKIKIPTFKQIFIEKFQCFKESKRKSINEKPNDEQKSENPESDTVGKAKSAVEEKVEDQESGTPITSQIPQEAVVEMHSESEVENATSISSPPETNEPSLPKPHAPPKRRKRGRPKAKSKTAPKPKSRSTSKTSSVSTEECVPIPVENEVQETASAAELISEADTPPDQDTNTKYPLRTRRPRRNVSLRWLESETDLMKAKVSSNQKVDYLKVMSEEVDKPDPNISLLSDAMAHTFKWRKKMVDDPEKDVQQIVRKYPALRLYQVIKEEYGRVQNDLTKMDSLENGLEPLLKEALQVKMKKFGYRHPIKIQVRKKWRETKDCDPRLEQVLGMLALCFHFAENKVLTNLCRILEDDEELGDTSKLVTPTLVLKRSQIFETESEMWIYVETSKYLRVPNFYEGVLSIYSIYYVFNLCYDNKLKVIYEFFDMIIGNPQSTYKKSKSLRR